jgi:hypothetical protein
MRIALRYDGFQCAAANIRRFIFHWDPAREDCQRICVDDNLAHFEKYHVGIQEGPALCIWKIVTLARARMASASHSDVHLELGEGDIRDFTQACLTVRGKRTSKLSVRHARASKTVAANPPVPETETKRLSLDLTLPSSECHD